MRSMTKASSSLPVSSSDHKQEEEGGGIRRRLSSLNLKIQASPAAAWYSSSFPRHSRSTKSMMNDYAAGGMISIRKWWDWSCAWILSRKPIFATDLEMNDHETKSLGSHNRGTWRHVFFKLRSHITRRFFSLTDHASLPQTHHQYHR